MTRPNLAAGNLSSLGDTFEPTVDALFAERLRRSLKATGQGAPVSLMVIEANSYFLWKGGRTSIPIISFFFWGDETAMICTASVMLGWPGRDNVRQAFEEEYVIPYWETRPFATSQLAICQTGLVKQVHRFLDAELPTTK